MKQAGRDATMSGELLPCPLPCPWLIEPFSGASRRRHRRCSERRALEILVNLQVCAVNFCSLGMPGRCPLRGCTACCLGSRGTYGAGLLGDLTGCGSKLTAVRSEVIDFEPLFDELKEVVYGSARQNLANLASVQALQSFPPLLASGVSQRASRFSSCSLSP